MKLLLQQIIKRISGYFSAFGEIMVENFNFMIVMISCLIISLEILFDENNRGKDEIIILSVIFGLNVLSYLMKRLLKEKQQGEWYYQIIEICVVISSMEIFFTLNQQDIFVLYLLQIQCILSNKQFNHKFINLITQLSVPYFGFRYFLSLNSYTTHYILTVILRLFFILSGFILAFHWDVLSKQQIVNKQNEQQLSVKTQQKWAKFVSIFKASENTNSLQQLKLQEDSLKWKQQRKVNLIVKDEENQLDQQSSLKKQQILKQQSSQQQHLILFSNDDDIHLNNSERNSQKIPLSPAFKSRDVDLESMVSSYRTHDYLILNQLQEDRKKLQQQLQINSHHSIQSPYIQTPLVIDDSIKQKAKDNGVHFNILSELSLGMVIIDDQRQIIFQNDRSMKIVKEGNSSNFLNKLYEYAVISKEYGMNNQKDNMSNNNITQSKSSNDAKNSTFILDEKPIKQENKLNQQSIQRLTSIQLKDNKDEELSPLQQDVKKKKTEQAINNNSNINNSNNKKGSSGRLFPASLRDLLISNTIYQDTTKYTKLFSGGNSNEDKLSLSDYKEETLFNQNLTQYQQKSQYGNKLSINIDCHSSCSPPKNHHLSPQLQPTEVKQSDVQRLNINLNRELQNLLKQKQQQPITLKQIFDILLDTGNYQQNDSSTINQNWNNGLIKSKSENMIDSFSTESKYYIKKQDHFSKKKAFNQDDQMQGSTLCYYGRDSENIQQDDSICQSKEINPLSCSIIDNILIIKAQKGKDIIDLKISALLEISSTLVSETNKNGKWKESVSGEATADQYPEKLITSNLKIDKFRDSTEEFKLPSLQYNVQKLSSYFGSSFINNDVKQEKTRRHRGKRVKNCEVKLFLVIEIYDKKEETEQINKDVFRDFKNKILSSLSHELRTPLNCSLSMLETLFHSDILNESQKKMLVLPALNSNYLLLSMINDILDFAQLINGGLNLQFHEFNIVDLLRECMSYFTLQAAHKNIYMELSFDKTLPVSIRSDSMRMKQVIINLLSNAIKFSSQGQITINVDLEEKDLLKISISDTGCGIPPEIGNLIFRGLEFNQKNTQFNTEGAGMGLTIANNISKGLSGNRPIQFKSEVNKGSTFSFFVLDRPSKIKGCKSTKFTLFNRSFTNWKPLFQDSSEKIAPSTVFDQITQNNNKIIGSNSMLPQFSIASPIQNLLQSQHSQHGQQQHQQYQQKGKSKSFSNTYLPQRSLGELNNKIISNYINNYMNYDNFSSNNNSNYNNNNNNINNNTHHHPQTNNNNINNYSHNIPNYNNHNFNAANSNNNNSNSNHQHKFKNQSSLSYQNNQVICHSDDQIPSLNSIPKSFQDLSFARMNKEVNQSLDQISKYEIRFPSQGNINVDEYKIISTYKFEQNRTRYLLEPYQLQSSPQQQHQTSHINNLQSKNNNANNNNNNNNNNNKGISSLRQIEEAVSSRVSCEVETETSLTRNKNHQPQINLAHFIVGRKKSQDHNANIQFNLPNRKDEVIQRDKQEFSDKNLKQICLTDEPISSYAQNQNKDEFSNKQISHQQIHSFRTLLNDTFSIGEQKQVQKGGDEENSLQQQQSNTQNYSNKNSTNQLVQSSNSKHPRIKDLEIEDIQTNLQYFLSLQQSSHISHMYGSNTNFQQPTIPYNQYIYNNCNSPKNASLLFNSLTQQSNLSQNINQPSLNKRDVDSPRSQKINKIQTQNNSTNSFSSLHMKIQKKQYQLDSQNLKINDTHSQSSQHNPNQDEVRQRVDSSRSKKQEIQNSKMENIIETHENQEADDNSLSQKNKSKKDHYLYSRSSNNNHSHNNNLININNNHINSNINHINHINTNNNTNNYNNNSNNNHSNNNNKDMNNRTRNISQDKKEIRKQKSGETLSGIGLIEGSKQKIINKNKEKKCSCSDILIVDDNDFNLFALQIRLQQYSFIVEIANSGLLGQEKVISRHQQSNCCKKHALILMDLDMPIQNGFQTTANIIQYFQQSKTSPPVISACTAFVSDVERRKAKKVGMNYYLTKPVDVISLEKILLKVLFQLP